MWEDITTYSRVDKERIPRTWKFSGNGLSVVVFRHIYCNPDVWFLRCEPFFSLKELKNKDIDAAKEEAIEIVTNCLWNTIQSLKGGKRI